MGLMGRSRSRTGLGNSWVPPVFGACECEGHIEDVLELRIPLADSGDGFPRPEDMAVWALLTSGGLATVPLAEERRHLTDGVSIEPQGPFHWKVSAGERFRPFLSGGDHSRLEQALAGQTGVDSAMWIRREGALVVGAPRLCANGVQCAVVQALRSSYVRQSAVTPTSVS
jgi:hypothetical protein